MIKGNKRRQDKNKTKQNKTKQNKMVETVGRSGENELKSKETALIPYLKDATTDLIMNIK